MRRDVKSRSVINSGLVCTLVSYVTVARFWWCFKMFYIRNNHSTVSRESCFERLDKIACGGVHFICKSGRMWKCFPGLFSAAIFQSNFWQCCYYLFSALQSIMILRMLFQPHCSWVGFRNIGYTHAKCGVVYSFDPVFRYCPSLDKDLFSNEFLLKPLWHKTCLKFRIKRKIGWWEA